MQVQQYHKVDLVVAAAADADASEIQNPFLIKVTGTFVAPSGQTLTIPGFYDGEGRWVVRFSPTEVGRWTWSIASDDLPELADGGELECVPNTHAEIHGGLGVNPDAPRWFRYEDGSDYYMMAYEVDWLFALYMQDPAACGAFVDMLAGYRFNSMIMNVYAHEANWSDKTTKGLVTPPPIYPWEGTNAAPDHSRLNPAFFQAFDGLMDLLLNRGITAHLFLYVYNKNVNWPEVGSPEDCLYLDYVVARYQAYANVIWDYAKECRYLTDKDMLTEMLQRIRAKDAYGRLLTVHDHKPYWADVRSDILDFKTLQHHSDFHILPQLEYCKRQCPVINSEYGYECGPGGVEDKTYGRANTIEEFMDRTYEVAMGGASICYYYTYTAWDIIRPEDTPPGYAACRALYDLMVSLPWHDFEPLPHECISTPTACFGNPSTGEYLLKPNQYGWFLMSRDCREIKMTGTWMHVVTGEERPLIRDDYAPNPISLGMTRFASPFGGLGVLRVKMTRDGELA